ncbi:nicotinate phosphoribosyltransferase [Candidatus Woesebacteria bacterium]|nr:nicotinate phosphoribosyltransferase [Candidatus Woesebacteria bacterium]
MSNLERERLGSPENLVDVRSPMDTDYYKITMGQLVFFNFPTVDVRYRLIPRRQIVFPEGFDKTLTGLIQAMGALQTSQEEINYLARKAPYLKPNYLDWLKSYRFNPGEVNVSQKEGQLEVNIEGPWYRTIYWEVPLMAAISGAFFKETKKSPDWLNSAREKARILKENGIKWADFGTRRRFSHEVQSKVIEAASEFADEGEGGFVGTSNVNLAYINGCRFIGTLAHEVPQVVGALFGPQVANEMVLGLWQKEFRGQLGTALPDTFTTDVFLRNFNHDAAKLWDGVRHDSGDPMVFVNKIVAHYQKLGINPMEKTIIFSDGLRLEKMLELNEYCKGKVKCSFGIGTNFTNDVGATPLDIVIKVVEARLPGQMWQHAIKLSDNPEKWTGDPGAIENARQLLGLTR